MANPLKCVNFHYECWCNFVVEIFMNNNFFTELCVFIYQLKWRRHYYFWSACWQGDVWVICSMHVSLLRFLKSSISAHSLKVQLGTEQLGIQHISWGTDMSTSLRIQSATFQPPDALKPLQATFSIKSDAVTLHFSPTLSHCPWLYCSHESIYLPGWI